MLRADPQFSMLHGRLAHILSASEVVLMDSISPAENRKRIAEMERAAKNKPTDEK